MDKLLNAGIVTFHRALNYGAILQAFALCKFLKKMGVAPFIVDYRCPRKEKQYYSLSISINTSFLHNIRRIITLRRRKKNAKYFEKFSRFLPKTEAVYCLEKLKQIGKDMDFFIAGGDQVFRPDLSDGDDAYFLSFLEDKKKKYSYAASFGYIDDRIKTERIHRLLNNFSCLSFREASAVDFVRATWNIKGERHVDPALLLDGEAWTHLFPCDIVKNDFILLYLMDNNPLLYKYAEYLAKKEGLRVIVIADGLRRPIRNAKYIRSCSVEDFLGYFQKASYVLTTSFHGTVFAILFHKKFLCGIHNNHSINNRAYELLELLGLEKRSLHENSTIQDIQEAIDWESVEKKLEQERVRSANYFQDIIRKIDSVEA